MGKDSPDIPRLRPGPLEIEQAQQLRELNTTFGPARNLITGAALNTLFPNFAQTNVRQPGVPRTFSAADLRNIWLSAGPENLKDVDFLLSQLPPDFTPEQFQQVAADPKVRRKLVGAKSTAALRAAEQAFSPSTTPDIASPELQASIAGTDLFSTTATAAEREALERQFSVARSQAGQASGARGGIRTALLSDVDQARAEASTRLTSEAQQRGLQQALGVLAPAAIPNAGTTLQLGAQLAGTEAQRIQQNLMNRINQQQQQDAGLLASLGQIGQMAGKGATLFG